VSDLTHVAALCDAVLGERVVVLGSHPHDARDLDLLVSPAAERALASGLRAAGFVGLDGTWARIRPPVPEVVDLVPSAAWGLRADVVEDLVEASRPLPGLRHVAVPAPHHVVLLSAWRMAGERGVLGQRHRTRLAAAEAQDPDAWGKARQEAARWGCLRALDDLERRYRDGRDTTRRRRVQARRERFRSEGRSPVAATWRAVVPASRRRAEVVSFSGLDGSGKTTQAQLLVAALDAVGHPAMHEWSRLTYEPSVDFVARNVTALLTRVRRRPVPPDPEGARDVPTGQATEDEELELAPQSTGQRLRERSIVLHHGWVTALAVLNAWGHRAAARRAARQGRVLVRDRYVIDSLVQLRTEYGRGGRLPLQSWLLERLTPSAVRSYYLDVPPVIAHERKQDYPVADLERHREEYLRAVGSGPVVTLDGRRDAEDLGAQVAVDVWRALGARNH
jgi:thymidylate kinase